MNEAAKTYRVIYVGTGRQARSRFVSRIGWYESERAWRRRLAEEMEEACQEMARRGLRLIATIPVLSSAGLQGSWTEGAWLYFGEDASVTSRGLP